MGLNIKFGAVAASMLLGITAIAPATIILTTPQSVEAAVATGRGTLAIGSRPALSVNRVTVDTIADNTAKIQLRASNGNQINFGGKWENGPQSQLLVTLTNSGNADASGIIVVTYRNGQLQSIFGGGKLDGQPFTIDFRR
ncbi:hypothetical protein ACE1CI_30160 [Aerosakkonemataceae cyanobacterium BLCC-F50]|uniref:Uncharacterized protein n=1 Tax=Floridaenema flaviceps BLCC-F50 TaxID=3153642 RepID=A0ABV4XZU9_9CYAN